jgi:hypothetical protein
MLHDPPQQSRGETRIDPFPDIGMLNAALAADGSAKVKREAFLLLREAKSGVPGWKFMEPQSPATSCAPWSSASSDCMNNARRSPTT